MVTKVRDVPDKVDSPPMITDADASQHDPLDVDFPVNVQLLTRNLILFTVLKTIGSFDSGAFSAALGAENGIAEEWGLSTVHQGTLSSSVFLGNILGCPLSGNLFSRYSAKAVLVWSLILHTLFTFLFATLTEYRCALLCRFLIGITLSFVIVYTPVWVDTFAPRDRQSMWMASHNAGVPLGIMLGYCIGAFLPSYTNVNWEWAFYIKCIITIPAVAYLIRVDSRSIDRRVTVNSSNNRCDTVTSQAMSPLPPHRRAAERIFNILHSNILFMWRACVPLFHSTEYMCSMLAMCSLYFVVTGLQNFVTQYLRDEPFKASMKTIMVGFGGAVVTAPVLGVITGGILLDRIGGYQHNLRRVTTFTCMWGTAAAFFSVMCIFVTSTHVFLLVISIVLFCGGAIIPPGSGTVVASVPEQLRPAGAAFSQMMYNLLGNFSGPMVCGVVADLTGDLKYGIYTVLSFSVVGLLPMLVLLRKAYRMPEVLDTITPSVLSSGRLRRHHHHHHHDDEIEMDGDSVVVEMKGMGSSMKSESPRTVLQDDDMPLFDSSSSTSCNNNYINHNNSNSNNNNTYTNRIVLNAVGSVGATTMNTMNSTLTAGTPRSSAYTAAPQRSSLLSYNTTIPTPTTIPTTTTTTTTTMAASRTTPIITQNTNTQATTTITTTTAAAAVAAQRGVPYVVVVENTAPTSPVEIPPTPPAHPLPMPSIIPSRYANSEVSAMADQQTGGVRSSLTESRSRTNYNSHGNHMSCSTNGSTCRRNSRSSSTSTDSSINREEEEANFRLEIGADAAQMMSFPNQHNFGLDMLRSWLNSSMHRHSSQQSSIHAMQSLLSDSFEVEDVEGLRVGSSERREIESSLIIPLPPPSSLLSLQEQGEEGEVEENVNVREPSPSPSPQQQQQQEEQQEKQGERGEGQDSSHSDVKDKVGE
ncbi:putative transporter protein [Trypanosoma theileri]|uniref:Putative transporter protein n=1 Tax=Trypanosoma theileri TaxID=67003 RepID=A0A1X0NTC8_9TRYP|nr:putative transporter protein [Trypanosoma theileri]ORC87964.1 putative transporter protein [Trypanosoma theileri]